jgi:hypothetical protein
MALIPVLCAATIVFSTKTMAKDAPDVFPKQTVVQEEETLLTVGQGVSQELLDEYKAIESKYIEHLEKSPDGSVKKITWKTMSLSENDLQRLYIIYVQMDEAQHRKQNISFVGPLTPMKFRRPNNDEWNACKRADILWLDGKKIDNSALDSFVRSDVHFFINGKIENGTFQSAVWTKKGYEAYIQQYAKQIPVSKLLDIKPQAWCALGKTLR